MAKVSVALLAGNRGTRDRDGWKTKDQVIRVSGLPRTLGHDDLVIRAYQAAVAAGFVYASEHPQITGIFMLGDMDFEVVYSNTVDIKVSYQRKSLKDPDYIHVKGSVSVVTEKTNLDAAGIEIKTGWKREESSTAIYQYGEIDKQIQCLTLEFSKRLDVNPAALFKALVGWTNLEAFQGDEAGCWLIVDGGFDSPDGGLHWDTSIKIAYNQKQWKQTIYYVDENGKPPGNWLAAYNDGLTVKQIQVYGKKTFAPLGLPDVVTVRT